MTYGLYSRGLTLDEAERWDAGVFKPGSLDAEIQLLRVQLERTVAAYRAFLERPDDPSLLTLVEQTEDKHTEQPYRAEGEAGIQPQAAVDVVSTHKRRKRPDFTQHILRLTGRIAELEAKRMSQGLPEPPAAGLPGDAMSDRDFARRIAFILAKAAQPA